MTESRLPAIQAQEAPLRQRPSLYPQPFASRMAGRHKRPLGELFGLSRFGVNWVVLQLGAVSALRHAHTQQDEVDLEVGDRMPGDRVTCPDDDLVAADEGGRWRFFHRDGSPYPKGERG